MLEEARNILKKSIGAEEKVAVAVSGGKDSMCLLDLVLTCGYFDLSNIYVININHGIRGGESDKDSAFVGKYCADAGIKCIEKKIDVPLLSIKSGKSLETQARDERRRAFDRLIEEGIVEKVLLAHHRNDQVETILMHIFRGCGIGGLVGMKEVSGNIVRPLLKNSQKEIDAYIAERNIPFITDETNFLNDYSRNYIRNELLPKIREKWLSVDSSLIHLSEAASATDRYMNDLLEISNIVTDELPDGVVKLRMECFEEDAPYSWYIFKALKMLNIQTDIEYKHIQKIKELAGKRNGAKINLTGRVIAIKEYDTVTFFKEKKVLDVKDDFKLGIFTFDNKRIVIKSAPKPLVKHGLIFDYDKVPHDSVIRKRENGDIFKPVNGGTKKLKDYLIDRKIPVRLRDRIPCLCNGNEVLMLFGIEISDKIKIDEHTQNAAKAEITEL